MTDVVVVAVVVWVAFVLLLADNNAEGVETWQWDVGRWTIMSADDAADRCSLVASNDGRHCEAVAVAAVAAAAWLSSVCRQCD